MLPPEFAMLLQTSAGTVLPTYVLAFTVFNTVVALYIAAKALKKTA